MIHVAKPGTIRMLSHSKLAYRKPLVLIPKMTAHLTDIEWTEDEHVQLQILVERYTTHGGSGAWRVHRWRLPCFSFVLGDIENCNVISGQWHDESPVDTWVDSPILQWLQDTFLLMLMNKPAEFPDPDRGDASSEARHCVKHGIKWGEASSEARHQVRWGIKWGEASSEVRHQVRWGMKWGTPSETRENWQWAPQSICTTKGGAQLLSSWPGSSFWSSGWPSILRIVWIYSKFRRKWVLLNAQKCSSNSRIQEIPWYSSLHPKWADEA